MAVRNEFLLVLILLLVGVAAAAPDVDLSRDVVIQLIGDAVMFSLDALFNLNRFAFQNLATGNVDYVHLYDWWAIMTIFSTALTNLKDGTFVGMREFFYRYNCKMDGVNNKKRKRLTATDIFVDYNTHE